MANRPTDWHVLDLDDDPTPGDPERVKQLARELHDFADDVADALRQIKGMAGEDALLRWAGKTAKAFQDEFDEVPKNLKKLQRSYDLAGDALAAYWPKLERAQSLADKALAKGREAQSELTAANGRLDSANSWVDRATKKTEEYDEKEGKEKPDESEVRAATRNATDAKSAQSSAQTAVDNAESGLEAAKKMAADAKKMREDAASEAKDKLDDASDAGIQNRKWWEKAVDWVKDNWDTIVSVCKVIVAVLGIVVLIIGGPLAWVVLAAALVVLADTLYKYMNGQASLFDVAMAALDCIPGMKGLTSLAKLGKGLTALKGGLKGMALGAKGLAKAGGRAMKKLFTCGDPVDVATGELVMSANDVSLPGTLSLTLERHHRSGFRHGRLFGLSWASTLDQQLVADEVGVRYHTEDGMVLYYPAPGADEGPVLPVEGPRWPLEVAEAAPDPATGGSVLVVRRPETGQSFHFRAVPGRPGTESALTAVTDRNGTGISVRYDAEGFPAKIVHSGGYRVGVVVAQGRIAEFRLVGEGDETTLVSFGYDEHGNLSDVVNSSGLPLRFTYDDEHRITSWLDRNRTSYRYEYDAAGRCVHSYGSGGLLDYSYVYDERTRTTTATNSLGATIRYAFNDSYRPIAETDPLGHTTHRTWDRHDRLTALTDPLGRTTRFTYDEQGNTTSVTHPDGTVSTAEYNELGLPATVRTPGERQWEYAYDDAGNMVRATDPTGAATRYEYDDAGSLVVVSDPVGGVRRIVSDRAGLPVSVIDPGDTTTTYERDAFGRPTAVVEATGARTELRWSIEGLLIGKTGPDGASETWTYDGEGNCTSHVDPIGGTTRFGIGPFDVVEERTDPDGARYTFTHDSELRLTEVRNPLGQVWRYTYDAVGRTVAETDFDGREHLREFDAADQLTRRVNPVGETLELRYDTMGRLIGQRAGRAESTFRYDDAGEMVEAAGPHAVIRWERDLLGRILTETVDGRTLRFSYDAAGRRLDRLTPAGSSSAWSYDRAGNPARLTVDGHTLDFRHDAAGHELARRIAGGPVAVTSEWDAAGRLHEQALPGGAGDRPAKRSYRYRGDGVPTEIHDPYGGRVEMTVDAMGRITEAVSDGGTETYSYDAAGNQVAADWPGQPHDEGAAGARSYTGTLLERAGGVRYEYDGAGRPLVRRRKRLSRKPDVWRYEWDAEDRLVALTTPDGARWRYLYDPLGRRTAKQRLDEAGDVVEQTVFVWDGGTLVEQTSTGAGLPYPVTQTWNHDRHRPLTQSERITDAEAAQEVVDSRFFAIVTDLVGTPTELLDGTSGHTAWRSRTTIWGNTAWSADSTAYCPLRFPGQYFDPESGLHYNYFRYYDPGTARYLTPDPLGLDPAPNPTAYVTNPLVWSDPFGLAPCTILADTDLMVKAMRGHANALAEIQSKIVKITPNQLREFLDVTNGMNARKAFLKDNSISVISPADARRWASSPEFKEMFAKVMKSGHSRGDAALVAFARASGIEAVTMEKRLSNFVNMTLQVPDVIRRVT
ncbi:RHS repeat-associated core domain-containing protein [Streptomyces sp. B8F3]|uniref:RHS repeat-associated core domain-containing protein n=1 Tax=unclassified Streptomyces TaxID=2593676 RepID=UPI00325E813B